MAPLSVQNDGAGIKRGRPRSWQKVFSRSRIYLLQATPPTKVTAFISGCAFSAMRSF